MKYKKSEVLQNPGGYVILPEVKKLPEEIDKVFEQLKYGKVFGMDMLENLVNFHKTSMNFLIYHKRSGETEKYSWEEELIKLFLLTGLEFGKSKIYDKAISILELVIEADTEKETATQDILVEIYLRANKTSGLTTFLGDKRDEIYLTTCLLANIIEDDIYSARGYLEELAKLNPTMIKAIFDAETIEELLEKIRHKELELSQDAEIALVKYEDYFSGTYCWNMLKYLLTTSSEDDEEVEDGVTAEIYELLKEAKINNAYSLAGAINRFGILTKKHFKDYTKKQLQSINGIGPKTLEKLEVVGAKFKEN